MNSSGFYDFDQIPFGNNDIELAENPEPRCACLLLLDNSGSMSGSKIDELNKGLQIFKEELMADNLASKRVEVAIVSFGPVEVIQDFCGAERFIPPTLQARGATPMGEAILLGLDLLENRKAKYKENGLAFFRPWVFLITDGGPTDDWRSASEKVRTGETKKSFAFFSVGVGDANMEILKKISLRQPLHLQGVKFREMFVWLSNSMRSVSNSVPNTEVTLIDPTSGPHGWASV